MKHERRLEIIEVWKTIVEVQKHFNDIEMRIRSLFVTMILAVAAAQGFLMEKGLSLELGEMRILYATFMPVLGAIAGLLFYFMDRYWYHRLLLGAVNHGRKIEEEYQNEMPELSLSEAIKVESPINLNRWITKFICNLIVTDHNYIDKGELHSVGKIEFFYKPIIWLFVLTFLATFFFGGILIKDKTLSSILWRCLA